MGSANPKSVRSAIAPIRALASTFSFVGTRASTAVADGGIQRVFDLWRRAGSLSLTFAAARHFATVPALSILRRGGELRRAPGGVTLVYKGASFAFPSFAAFGMSALADMLDAGYSFHQLDGDRWTLETNEGLRFVIHKDSMGSDLLVLKDRFVDKEYDFLPVDGRVVLDIGANIGDSAAYFVSRGAKAAYGFEPFGGTFSRARENIELSGLSKTVHLFQLGVSGREGEWEANFEPSAATNLSTLPESQHRVLGLERAKTTLDRVKMVTLSRAIEMCRLRKEDLVVCKMDCEGSEFDILSQPNVVQDLRRFERILIEYHWHSPSPLIRVLEAAGFETELREAGREYGLLHGFSHSN